MEFDLRKAEKQDWEFIWLLRLKTMKETIVNSYGWDEKTQQSYAEESYNEGQIVIVNNKPIGVVTLSDWIDQLHLTWIAIVPEFQRKGVGTKLIKYCQEQAIKIQKPLTLQVLRNNRAFSLYKQCGFQIINESNSGKLIMRWIPE
jgi:ribosomal protein S18 acetylase RimI-like enzyme